MSALILAVANQKGGTGKTTTTFHLARAAINAGQRVLLIDSDAQGSITGITSADPLPMDAVGLADALSFTTPDTLRDVIVASVWDGMDLVPTTGDTLATVRDELKGHPYRLREVIAQDGIRDTYDLVLIDCPPGIDEIFVNILVGADTILLIAEETLYGVNGVNKLLLNIANVREQYHPELQVAGVLFNGVKPRTVSSGTWTTRMQEITAEEQIPLLAPGIPERMVISDAPQAGYGLDQWGGRMAKDLAALYATHLATIQSNHAGRKA